MSDMAGGLGPRLGKSAAAVERCGKQPRYNGANGMSDIEGKAAREAVRECGQRASLNRAVGASEMDGQVCVGNR